MTIQITIHPTVKAELEAKFSQFGLAELFIKSYEGVYNLAFQDGYSLEEGHLMAMKALENLTKMLTK